MKHCKNLESILLSLALGQISQISLSGQKQSNNNNNKTEKSRPEIDEAFYLELV